MSTSKRANTVYRGARVTDGHDSPIGVWVTANGLPLRLPPAFGAAGYEWGYGGHGSRMLAIALILDATGDPRCAVETAVWFMWAKVACWGRDWSITAAEVRRWVEQAQCELTAEVTAAKDLDGARPVCGRIGPVRRCRECGCTDADCRQCIAATGRPCRWVPGEPDLCSRCVPSPVDDLGDDPEVAAIFAEWRRTGGVE